VIRHGKSYREETTLALGGLSERHDDAANVDAASDDALSPERWPADAVTVDINVEM
jgi:hypothetical protein